MKKSWKGKPVLPRGRAVVGIDIGKRKHAATALSPQGEVIAQLAAFPNTRQGVDQLEKEVLRKAGGPGKVLVGMEATGHYWMCLYHELTRRGYACVVLNPLQTNARSSGEPRPTAAKSPPGESRNLRFTTKRGGHCRLDGSTCLDKLGHSDSPRRIFSGVVGGKRIEDRASRMRCSYIFTEIYRRRPRPLMSPHG